MAKFSDTLAAQLASFEARLESKADDVQMLTDIQDGIGKLLSENGNNEADIRRVLQERYEAGELRKETFQLVKSMLDRYVTEHLPTGPDPEPEENTTLTGTQILDDPPEFEEPVEMAEVFADASPVTKRPPEDDFSTTDVLEEGKVEAKSVESSVQVGTLLRDRFLLKEKVAGGSMGTVYKALDKRLAEAGSESAYVAIKVLSPQLARNGQALRALQQEAAKGRCLVHPNIVRFIDLDREGDLYFIVMEWLEGRNLAEILDDPSTKKFEPSRALEIVKSIGDALEYAHRCGIVHADVKPGNIMMMPNGEAKLFDFGIARVRQSQIGASEEFAANDLGAITPAYSSMQVLTGEEPVPADDVFSLACLFYRLLAGYRVFGPRNAAEAAEEGMTPQQLDVLSDSQWRAMKKALSYSRVTRFESMQEFIDALDAGVEDDTISLEVERNYEVEDSGGGFAKWLIALVMIIGAAGVAANKMGYLDEFKAQLLKDPSAAVTEQAPPVIDKIVAEPEPIAGEQLEESGTAATAETAVVSAPVEAEAGAEAVVAAEEPVASDEPVSGASPEADSEASEPAPAAAEPVAVENNLFDFSLLPAANLQVPFSTTGSSGEAYTLTLLEDADSASIELVRDNTSEALTVRLEEVGFSGNRSPWASSQYILSDDGLIDFPAGQAYGRIKISMASDQEREADQQSTIRIRDVDNPASEFARITVFLQDDDQRAFEAQIPANTIAFSASQVTVDESDPAVTVDVVRFNPDSTSVVFEYQIESVTASENEDYFAPAIRQIAFGPGQRSARVLIPLVQDSVAEGNEAFAIQLLANEPVERMDVYQRIIVMIRDDE